MSLLLADILGCFYYNWAGFKKEREWKYARTLEVYAWIWTLLTSTASCWSKSVISPGQMDEEERGSIFNDRRTMIRLVNVGDTGESKGLWQPALSTKS